MNRSDTDVQVVELRVEKGKVVERRKADHIPDEEVRDCLLIAECKVRELDYPACRIKCVHYKNHLAIESAKRENDLF